MVGLLVAQVLRAYGCERVIGVDIDPGHLALVEKLGVETISGGAEGVAAAVFERASVLAPISRSKSLESRTQSTRLSRLFAKVIIQVPREP